MNAGPELDRLMAEKVMGWKVCVEPLTCVGCNTDTILSGDGKVWHRGDIWSPSANIAHAFDLVEKFTDLTLEKSGLNYTVTVSHCTVTSKSAAHAISLAALKAVGGGE